VARAEPSTPRAEEGTEGPQYRRITPMTTPCTCTSAGTTSGCHRRVGRLQPHLPVLAVELLQRDVGAAEQRDHHLAVVGRLPILDDDEVAVADLLVDHRVALDPQDVRVALADQRFGHGDRLVARDGLDGTAGRDVPEQRQLDARPPVRVGTSSTERLRFHARLMKPFSCRFVRCLCTVASDDRPKRRPISSRLGA
jgi:hypothetical protein